MCVWGHASKGKLCMYKHKVGISRLCPKSGCDFASQPDLEEDEAKHCLEQHLKISQKIGHKVIQSESKHKPRRKSTKEESTCPICFKLFDNKYNAKRHQMQAHEQAAWFQCDNCEKSFTAKISLQYHKLKIHKQENDKIKCEKCDDTFNAFEDYAQHRDKHRSRSYQLEQKCEICGIVIKGKSNLTRHCRDVHKQETRLNLEKVDVPLYFHKCDKCKARFKRRDHLKRHNKKHNHS
jgi:hypothetical protein